MTTFSVVTVCFNDAEALAGTIQSIVTQTFQDFQYVIQDGGSADSTRETIHTYADWIDVYNSEPDTGIYQAMNRAVRRCEGKYTLFINAADQLIEPSTLADVVSHLREGDDVVSGHAVDAHTGKTPVIRPPEMFWAGMTFDHQAAIVRTSLLKENPFDESLRISGDFEFFSRLRLAGRSFRSVPLKICRKPYQTGVSSSFVARFRERLGVAMKYFGSRHPVEAALTKELGNYLVREFGVEHRHDEIKAMSIEQLLALNENLTQVVARRDQAVGQ